MVLVGVSLGNLLMLDMGLLVNEGVSLLLLLNLRPPQDAVGPTYISHTHPDKVFLKQVNWCASAKVGSSRSLAQDPRSIIRPGLEHVGLREGDC